MIKKAMETAAKSEVGVHGNVAIARGTMVRMCCCKPPAQTLSVWLCVTLCVLACVRTGWHPAARGRVVSASGGGLRRHAHAAVRAFCFAPVKGCPLSFLSTSADGASDS